MWQTLCLDFTLDFVQFGMLKAIILPVLSEEGIVSTDITYIKIKDKGI